MILFFSSSFILNLAMPNLNNDFDQHEEFLNSLTQFGFTQAKLAAIDANGLHTTQDLIGLADKDIDNIMKIVRAVWYLQWMYHIRRRNASL
jgi:hypothetical protein